MYLIICVSVLKEGVLVWICNVRCIVGVYVHLCAGLICDDLVS